MHTHLQRTLLLASSWVLFMPAPAMAGTASVPMTVAVPASAPVSETAGMVVPTYRVPPVYPAEAQY
ncbi:MAG: hypothetical protein ACRES7_07940 [Gammaproteobacteria bacterium]